MDSPSGTWTRPQEHIPFREDKQLTGRRAASLHAHLGREQSHRDDLEALGYLWLYFLKGKLPWQGLGAEAEGEDKYHQIAEKKRELSLGLCRDVPREFCEYFRRVRALEFDEAPDYAGLRRVLAARRQRKGYAMDYQFDWKVAHSGDGGGGGGSSSHASDDKHGATQVVELMR